MTAGPLVFPVDADNTLLDNDQIRSHSPRR